VPRSLLRQLGWPTALVMALGAGYGAGWVYWGWRWRLAALEEPRSPLPCSDRRVADQIWRDLWSYSSGDSPMRMDVRFTRDRTRARLQVIQDGIPDDALAASKDSYWLAWAPQGGWDVTSCESSVLRCYRGSWFEPVDSACP
jgi:hypothetical protein